MMECSLPAGRWLVGEGERVQCRRWVLALRELDDGQECLIGGELGERDDAEDPQREESAQLGEFRANAELGRHPEWPVYPLADAGDGCVTSRPDVPGVC